MDWSVTILLEKFCVLVIIKTFSSILKHKFNKKLCWIFRADRFEKKNIYKYFLPIYCNFFSDGIRCNDFLTESIKQQIYDFSFFPAKNLSKM